MHFPVALTACTRVVYLQLLGYSTFAFLGLSKPITIS
jgi:hypothetical protein